MGFSDFKDKSGGRAAVQDNKSDASLSQWGGEGGGKTGDIPGKNSDIAFHPASTVEESYSGPGRNLKTESF